MNVILAAMASTALVFAAAQAENDRDHAHEHGKPAHTEHHREPAPRHHGAMPDHSPRNGHAMSNRLVPSPHPDRYRGNFHADRRFHAGPWHPPHGYHYRRWSYGDRLPSLYFGPNLWIARFGLYGLMAPPPDTVWVRNGPDALLVDRVTGEVLRVEYGVFY